VEQVAQRVQAYVDAGARHLVFTSCGDLDASLVTAQRMAEEVMPLVVAPAT
jgi:2-methylisocitrate lyase-like PEP mutase family enzyme